MTKMGLLLQANATFNMLNILNVLSKLHVYEKLELSSKKSPNPVPFQTFYFTPKKVDKPNRKVLKESATA